MSAFVQDIPAWAFALMVVAFGLAYVTAGIEVVGRIEPPEMRHTYNDIVGFVIAVVGVVYAVLLAWVAIAAWETMDTATAAVEREAGVVGDIHRLSEGLPADVGDPIRKESVAYLNAVVNGEWTTMAGGGHPYAARDNLEAMERLILGHEPSTITQTNIQSRLIALLASLYDARRERLTLAGDGIQPIVWWTIGLGNLILVGMTFMFGLEKTRHRTLSGLTSISTGLVLFMIVELDRPFMGSVSVDTEPYAIALDQMGGKP